MQALKKIIVNNVRTYNLLSRSFSASSDKPRKWNVTRLNHVAIAVPDLEKAMLMFRNVLGAKVSEPQPQEEHGVYTVFVELENTKLELLYPLGDNSPINNFLKKNKSGGIHHICVEVDNIEAAMVDVRTSGIRTLSERTSIGAHGLPVVFLHPKDTFGILTEFEQPEDV